MAIASLQPGFRFHPTDIELVMYYLKRKVMGKKLGVEAISELNIYLFSPWDLPDKSCLKSKDREWYFFCPRERKYASGSRMNRATESGYWKTTGKDRTVSYNDRVVGMVKTLVFHEGNAPHGNRTDWVLHEYRLEDKKLADIGVVQDSFVLCKVFKKSGPGPKNGSQYGAHFQEEEWDDVDVDVDVNPTLPSVAMSVPIHPLPETQNCSIAVGMAPPGRGDIPLMMETQQSQVQSSSNNGYHCIFRNCTIVADTVDPDRTFGLSLADVGSPFVNDQFNESDDIASMLAALFDDNALPPYNIQNLGSVNNGPTSQLTGNDSFNGLQNFHGIEAHRASQFCFDQSDILLENVVPFLEIADIDDSFVSAVEFSGQEPSYGGLYESYGPFGPEPSIFTGFSNVDNTSNHQLGQPFVHDASFGSLPNAIDGLVPALMFPQTAIGYNIDDFPLGVGSTEEQYNSASNSQPGNIL